MSKAGVFLLQLNKSILFLRFKEHQVAAKKLICSPCLIENRSKLALGALNTDWHFFSICFAPLIGGNLFGFLSFMFLCFVLDFLFSRFLWVKAG